MNAWRTHVVCVCVAVSKIESGRPKAICLSPPPNHARHFEKILVLRAHDSPSLSCLNLDLYEISNIRNRRTHVSSTPRGWFVSWAYLFTLHRGESEALASVKKAVISLQTNWSPRAANSTIVDGRDTPPARGIYALKKINTTLTNWKPAERKNIDHRVIFRIFQNFRIRLPFRLQQGPYHTTKNRLFIPKGMKE